jgi:hypothetical protein
VNDPFDTGAYNNILADVMMSRTGSRVGAAFLFAEVTATVRGHVVVEQMRVPITIIHDGHNTASIEFDWAAAGLDYSSLGLFASMDTRFQQFVVAGLWQRSTRKCTPSGRTHQRCVILISLGAVNTISYGPQTES